MTSSTLRVGLVVPRFAPFRGGMETYVAHAAAALARKGAEVTVITQVPRALELPRRAEQDGYTVERHHLPLGDIFDVPSPSAARAASRSGRFDVLWVHNYHTPLAWLAAEQARAPVVFTPHYHGVGHTPLRQALHRVYRPAGRRLMAASRRIVVDTDVEAGLVLRDFPRQVQPEKITVASADGGRSGAWTAAVSRRGAHRADRRTPGTVQAHRPAHPCDFRPDAGRGVPARLVIVGQGSGLAAYQNLAARLGAEDVVTFTGTVDEETLGRWWASTSLYATASLQEAFGIGLAEALVAGLPVVASGIPAHREVIRRAGSGALARLCEVDVPDVDAASQYADAMAAATLLDGVLQGARSTLHPAQRSGDGRTAPQDAQRGEIVSRP